MKLYKTRVTIDWAYNIQEHRGAAQNRTTFDFADSNCRRSRVSINDCPPIQAGMKVIAALEQPDDWRTLVAWKDEATGDLAGFSKEPYLLYAVLSGLFSAICIWVGMSTADPQIAVPCWILLAISVPTCIWASRTHRLARHLYEALEV